ncbi:MAG: hypothetical protein D8M59_09340 [Planctomycetes bacterium]|nr:hypothetical protein [Planctomycetota bacterium]
MPLVPASVGDVVDRLTILELKRAHLSSDDSRRGFVDSERQHLRAALSEQCGFNLDDLFRSELVCELADINAQLWDVEDDIRACLAANRFDADFIELARRVPTLNDHRSSLKYKINQQYDSELVEVKSYEGFELGTPNEQH